MASRFQRLIGGLLGEDVEKMSEEDRRRLAREGGLSALAGMLTGSGLIGGISGYGERRAKKQEEEAARKAFGAAEAELGQITPYLFGTAPPAPDMTPSAEGLQNVAVTARPTVSPQRALERFYSTPQGRAAAQLAPDLVKLAQEGVTGRTVGGAVYNPLTQQFSRPPEQPQPRTPVREVDAGDRKIVYFSDGTTEVVQKRATPSAAADGPVGPGGIRPTKGQEAVDKKFAETISDYVAGGGYADIEKQITQLEDVAQRLRSGEELSGPMIASMMENYPNLAAAWNAGAIDVQELVAEVAQRNLRAILGGQFAQQEGMQLIKRAYNPALKEDVNAQRIDRLVASMRKANQAKNDAIGYWNQYGTLAGYRGKIPTTIGLEDTTESKPAPTVGEIRESGGRRFQYLGGDPASPNSWKRL